MRTKNMNPPKKKKSATENAGNILLVPIHDPERGDRAVDLLGLKMSDELESHPPTSQEETPGWRFADLAL